MKVALAFVAMISCTVAANLLMKTGASSQGEAADFLSRATSWQVLFGIGCFAAAAILYVLILGWLPLNVAQSFAAAQFIAVIVAARLILGEPIADLQWLGIALISLGIGIVGWSQ
jgi:drug/metabolite transporter (DMT)-like permease